MYKQVAIPVANSISGSKRNFMVKLLSSPTATIGALDMATVNIVSGITQPAVQFSQPAYSVGAGQHTVTMPVNLYFVTTDTVTIAVNTVDGDATAGVDYTPISGTLTIPAGSSTGSVTVPILYPGTHRTFFLELSQPSDVTHPNTPVGLLSNIYVPVKL